MFATTVKRHMVEIAFALFDLQTTSLLGEDIDWLLRTTPSWRLSGFGMALVASYPHDYLAYSQ